MMGLVVLLTAGVVLGWLGSIVLRHERGRQILADIGAGAVGSVGAGIAESGGTAIDAISATTMLVGLAGATGLIALYNLARRGHSAPPR